MKTLRIEIHSGSIVPGHIELRASTDGAEPSRKPPLFIGPQNVGEVVQMLFDDMESDTPQELGVTN